MPNPAPRPRGGGRQAAVAIGLIVAAVTGAVMLDRLRVTVN